MKRRAKQPEPVTMLDQIGSVADFAGAKIAENPAVVGSSVAFAVVMFFVSSNALFYQPFKHDDALFATRSMETYVAPALPKPVSLNSIKSGANTAKNPGSIAMETGRPRDIQLIDIQSALAKMKLYDGTVDGVAGPKTKAAIQQFQVQAGLEPTGTIDPLLIDAIRTASIPAEKIPAPVLRDPMPELDEESAENAESASDSGLNDAEIRKIQAGLKAFGDSGIEIDGKIGTKTKIAIEEFQRLFQLEQTGIADRNTLSKMQELGLVSG